MLSFHACDALHRISRGVWRWMDRAARVANPALVKAPRSNMILRETTLTDYVVLRLAEELPQIAHVWTFPPELESNTGADMEIWFTDRKLYLGLRLQCKLMYPDGTFPHLHQKVQGSYQADTLINSAESTPGCLPVFLLYMGPAKVILPPRVVCRCALVPIISGGSLVWNGLWGLGNWFASAYKIRQLQRHGRNRVDDLWPSMFPWHCIVCCRDRGTPYLSPHSVYGALSSTVFQDGQPQNVEPVDNPPEYVRLAMEGRLPEAVDALRSLLEAREMRFLVLLDLPV